MDVSLLRHSCIAASSVPAIFCIAPPAIGKIHRALSSAELPGVAGTFVGEGCVLLACFLWSTHAPGLLP